MRWSSEPPAASSVAVFVAPRTCTAMSTITGWSSRLTRTAFGGRRQRRLAHRGHTGVRHCQTDDALERRPVLLSSAAQAPIQVLRDPVRRMPRSPSQGAAAGAGAAFRAWRSACLIHAESRSENGSRRAPWDWSPRECCHHQRFVRHGHHLIESEFTDRPRCRRRRRMRPSPPPTPFRRTPHRADAHLVDAVITEPHRSGRSRFSHTRLPVVGSVTPMPKSG